VVRARCGAVLIPGDLEAVAPGEGMPCVACVLCCATDAATAVMPPIGDSDWVDTAGSALSGVAYQQWGWPVTLHGDQVRLGLEGAVSAWMVPARWCAGVIRVLIQRRCAPLVLAHPYAPEQHIVLTGEKFGPRLPWPREVRQVSGGLLLPPSCTPRGPITWITIPQPDSLRLCREIDLFAALRDTAGGDAPEQGDPP
jgi:hypothetical protein